MNKKISFPLVIIILVACVGLIGGLLIYQYLWVPSHPQIPSSSPPSGVSTLQTEPIDLSGFGEKKISLTKYYSLAALDIPLKVSQYNLPLESNQITNFKNFSKKISLSDNALNLLGKNGFVVVNNPFSSTEEDITEPYNIQKTEKFLYLSLLTLYCTCIISSLTRP